MKVRRVEFSAHENAIKHICHNCGSKAVKQTYPYFRRLFYIGKGDSIFVDMIDEAAFICCWCAKSHVRVIAIAVQDGYQRRGFGSVLLDRAIQEARSRGKEYITLRTSEDEPALLFYLAKGFEVTGVKDNDIEMRLKL